MQRQGFCLIEKKKKMSKLRGYEPRRICDILRNLNSTEQLPVYHDAVRTTLCRLICKGNVVRKILLEKRYE